MITYSKEKAFELWIQENPKVWTLFIRFALEAIAKGHKHLSADMVLHRVRWESSVETVNTGAVDGQPLKVNNNFTPYLARKFHRQFLAHDGFFHLRKVREKQIELL